MLHGFGIGGMGVKASTDRRIFHRLLSPAHGAEHSVGKGPAPDP
ncbi:hypothetical protein LI99_22295 [Mycolicibacterium smegmatis]|uniref:Uncharacterized protein n=2 Tax=Mycolicibacterium smegmatis (strain ATCC 700084 / mc(2)155) TaxID=246196 RepID=I7FQ58_MYCS2|nr:hypothetical protein MSMEG_4506 [Mycolicibacterium smegmatis MC2 155]AIU16203.1 hypothetical protein LI99_22295 [Mycolicibacterium smegmatis]AFP40848.1 hypothetical protein MSMEI_4394 [Mycolicibacterium smegmatis MC2 155]AIU09578.1 hypothetical protein LJ00_22290 [Mycolicibacterium smegmatis MC2 155]AIU22826.1 hypothetical protein LI98_22300 [Mycolicibacterium smegmatis]